MLKENRSLDFLLGLLVIRTAFLSVADWLDSLGTIGFIGSLLPFPILFSDVKLSPATWQYMLDIHLVNILTAYMLKEEIKKYKDVLTVYFGIAVFHGIEYLFKYNSIWYQMGDTYLSSRIVTSLIFGWAVIKYKIKKLNNDY